MQVVLVQLDTRWENKAANFERVNALLREGDVRRGALVVLPEMFATGFSMHVSTIAEAEEGPTHEFLAQQARQRQVFMLGGAVTRAPDGRGRNQAVVFGPDGRLLARYSKLHPFSFINEARHYEAGDALVQFAWHDFQVAPFVCYDLRFPEVFRHATRAGATLLAVIANWPLPRETHWLALLRARAIENQAYVVGVNRAGADPHVPYGGPSLILDPRGETLAEGTSAECLVTAEIELAPLLEYRQQFPALADIRPEFL